jgi:SAM-dependent methyltransferase
MRHAKNRPGTVIAPRSHVDSDAQVRTRKAQKISSILQRRAPVGSGGSALDVGCGAGFVAHYLQRLGWSVVALDIADQRTTSGFDFVVGRAEALPFPSETFSVVVSNQVIEHVVDAAAHLREVRRVLAPGGLAYVATPNRFAVLEPHYKLPFLSWLPRGLADAYVRLLRRAENYDVFPLSRGRLLREAARAGLECDDITPWMVAETAAVERSPLARLGSALPDGVLRWLSHLSPTFVFVMRRVEIVR